MEAPLTQRLNPIRWQQPWKLNNYFRSCRAKYRGWHWAQEVGAMSNYSAMTLSLAVFFTMFLSSVVVIIGGGSNGRRRVKFPTQ
jgi:hypothetical protein